MEGDLSDAPRETEKAAEGGQHQQHCAGHRHRRDTYGIEIKGHGAGAEATRHGDSKLHIADAEAGWFVRVDHIGRPVFAANASGAQVWSLAYLPFGGVRASTGVPATLRAPPVRR